MKKIVFLLGCIVIFSCKKEKTNTEKTIETVTENVFVVTSDDAENILDWEGSYVGILPCKECEGKNTEIILKLDHTFIKSTSFINTDKKDLNEKGSFLWLEDGCTIVLNDKEKNKFKVSLNTLTLLNHNGEQNLKNTLHKNTCEENDFEEFTYIGDDTQKYTVIFGQGCDGLFAEVISDTISIQLLRETASENITTYSNQDNIKLIEKKNELILELKNQTIILTREN